MAPRRRPHNGRPKSTRDAILASANRLMRMHGYERTTMQQVVTDAGTSIGNAYFYFKNKDGLLSEVITRVLDRLWDENERVIATLDPGARRIATVIYGNVVHMLGQERKLTQAVIETQERVTAVHDHALIRWLPILATCCPQLSERERVTAASAIYGANRMIVGQALRNPSHEADEERAQFAVRWSLRALGFSESDVEDALATAMRTVV